MLTPHKDPRLDVKSSKLHPQGRGVHDLAMHRNGAHYGDWYYDRVEACLLHVSAGRMYPVRLEDFSTARSTLEVLSHLVECHGDNYPLGDFLQALSGLLDLRELSEATSSKPFDVSGHLRNCAAEIDRHDALHF